MRKVVAAINMTLDGFCDHTSVTPDDEIHQHYIDLIKNSGTLLYGRITYNLMEFWKTIVADPTDNKVMNEFAAAMDTVPKIVFSHTLKHVDWASASLATRSLKEEVLFLRQQEGKDISVGSRSLIIALLNEGLIDEFQLMIHPLLAGGGLPLFDAINPKISLKHVSTKTFGCGAVLVSYGRG